MEHNGFPFNCGRRGCLETIASASPSPTGMVCQVKGLIRENSSSEVSRYFQEKGEISTKNIFYLANKGNKSLQAVDALGFALAKLAVTMEAFRRLEIPLSKLLNIHFKRMLWLE